MKNAKYLCKIGCKDIADSTIVDVDFYTSKVSDIIEYAKHVKENETYPHKLTVINNTNGELLIMLEYGKNEYYIDSSAKKLASKILRKIWGDNYERP